MSVEQMNKLGLLTPDPPAPIAHNLDVRIPSPSVSPSGSSASYPSPTLSLPGAQVTPYIQLQGTTILLRPMGENLSQNRDMYAPTQLPHLTQHSTPVHAHSAVHRNIAPRQANTQPWRPW